MQRALDLHRRGNARVIPIILRPVDLRNAPFSQIKYLPHDGKPVLSWRNQDEAFVSVAKEIRLVIEELASD